MHNKYILNQDITIIYSLIYLQFFVLPFNCMKNKIKKGLPRPIYNMSNNYIVYINNETIPYELTINIEISLYKFKSNQQV